MKSITEFASFTLTNALKTKADLMAAGKTPEEIQETMGTTFKYEGDKLKHFVNALTVAEQNPAKLKRVVVMSLSEGEAAPAKAVKVEETHYVPEFIIDTKMQPQAKTSAKGGGKPNRGGPGGGGEKRGPKPSPWGMSPEEKAAKNAPKNKDAAAKAST